MNPSSYRLVALSPRDRAILGGRLHLLDRMMMWIYGAAAAFLMCVTVKVVLLDEEYRFENIRTSLYGVILVAGSGGAAHLALRWYERQGSQNLKADLFEGIKVMRSGVITEVVEGSENEPTRFKFSDGDSGFSGEFALRTIADLIRIKPGRMVGKRVDIEYAPHSGMVLSLRAAAPDTAVAEG